MLKPDDNDTIVPNAPAEPPAANAASAVAWEMIEPGRYQPKRICGSHPGRELG